MTTLIKASERNGDVAYKMKEIVRVLGYGQRFVDGLSDSQVNGMYYSRIVQGRGYKTKRESSAAIQRKQEMVRRAIELDELMVRRRAGLL